MNKKFFEIYQYLAPAVLSPLSLWLWWKTFDEHLLIALYIWSVPVIYAYIVPAIGINVLKVWEFDTRFRLGHFRPHHGFVFGSATATLAWICHFHQISDITGIFRYGFILASVLGFWNVLFDSYSTRACFHHCCLFFWDQQHCCYRQACPFLSIDAIHSECTVIRDAGRSGKYKKHKVPS